MTRRAKKQTAVHESNQNLVTVALARDEEEAKEYQSLLLSDNIPAEIKSQYEDESEEHSYAVLVPEKYVDEAYVVIESQDTYDDIYDLAMDEEEMDYGGDFDDDEF